MKAQPTRQNVIAIIEQLRHGIISRDYVSKWAFSIIDDPDVFIPDKLLWNVIQNLGAVDLSAPDREYLYENIDFDDWLDSLKT